LVRSRQLDNIEGKKAASIRSKTLDSYSLEMIEAFKRFKNGYDKDIIKQRNSLKKTLLNSLTPRMKIGTIISGTLNM
jgi:NADPH-dependent 7-cyano-7-deazaguanine reductase QueF-like protein